jgi:hypothetical protein
MNLNDLRWHDGNLAKFEILSDTENKSTTITIYAELYDDSVRTQCRDSYIIVCKDVISMNSICNFIEIINNSEFGSVHDGSHKGNVLRISLYDGYIEICANEFSVVKI